MAKACIWCLLIAGLIMPIYLAIGSLVAWLVQRGMIHAEPKPIVKEGTFFWFQEWSVRIGPFNIPFNPHVWAAAMVLVGSFLILVGLIPILHLPKAFDPELIDKHP